MSNYVIRRFESYPKALALKDLSGLEKSYRINNGEPLEASFPSNVTYHQHADYPDDLALGDTLLNSDMVVVGSKRLASFLASRSIPKLEFLPVRIVDRKGSELSPSTPSSTLEHDVRTPLARRGDRRAKVLGHSLSRSERVPRAVIGCWSFQRTTCGFCCSYRSRVERALRPRL